MNHQIYIFISILILYFSRTQQQKDGTLGRRGRFAMRTVCKCGGADAWSVILDSGPRQDCARGVAKKSVFASLI